MTVVENKDGKVEEIVAEEGNFAFCMQLQALEFMAEQEQLRVRKYELRGLSGLGTSLIRRGRRCRESRG